jgi:ABC-type transport system involved in multi-copper enzyme maturation permease subunit
MRTVRWIALVAWFDVREGLRSRRSLALLVLYAGAAVIGCSLFVQALAGIEATVASALKVSATQKPGALTQSLTQNREFQRLMARWVGDPALVGELLRIPPLSLFYVGFNLTVSPLFIALACADCVAHERATGACRYALVRVPRLAYCVGKLLGQLLIIALALAASGVVIYGTGAIRMTSFAWWNNAVWIAALGGRALCYATAYVGLTTGISQAVRSVHQARLLSLLAMLVLSGMRLVVHSKWAELHAPWLPPLLRAWLPGEHSTTLLAADITQRLPALLLLPALGCVYFSFGYLWFKRSDA